MKLWKPTMATRFFLSLFVFDLSSFEIPNPNFKKVSEPKSISIGLKTENQINDKGKCMKLWKPTMATRVLSPVAMTLRKGDIGLPLVRPSVRPFA